MALAQKTCETTASDLKEKCVQALQDADEVIKRQDELIVTVNAQNGSLRDENQQLSDALVELNSQYDSEIKHQLLLFGGGALLGVLVGVLVPR